MGILRELFAKPVYGPDGQMGDVALPRTPTGYAKPQRYWLQAPPGGPHTLNGRPYRSGQFIPGTTLFQHRAKNPDAPIPYMPLTQPGPAQTQQDGTHALPIPATAGGQVQGAPQSVGGEPLALPGGAYPQGPSDLPPNPATGPQSPTNAPGTQNTPQAGQIPQPVPQGPQPLRTPGLAPQDAVIEAQSQMFAWTNYGALRDAYFQQNAVLDPVSGDVRSLILNTDAWNQLIPGFTGGNSGAVHQAARWLNDQLFREALRNQSGKGNGKMIVLADGAQAGPGTQDFLEVSEYPLVLEQAARDYPDLADKFDRARAAGMKPAYQYVDRPVQDAISTAVERAVADRLSGKPPKVQPLEALARTNLDARRVALEVLFRNPDVESTIIDHHNGARFQRRVLTDPREAANYLAQNLAEDEARMPRDIERAKQDLIKRQKLGEVPADVVTGFLGNGWEIRPPMQFANDAQPVNYSDAGFHAAIDENPLEATNHLVLADYLDERAGTEEERLHAQFRRGMGNWIQAGGLHHDPTSIPDRPWGLGLGVGPIPRNRYHPPSPVGALPEGVDLGANHLMPHDAGGIPETQGVVDLATGNARWRTYRDMERALLNNYAPLLMFRIAESERKQEAEYRARMREIRNQRPGG